MRLALVRAWYERRAWLLLLAPLSLLYALVSGLRRRLYQAGILKVYRADIPVIVVGNVTAGGTGKTPLTLALIERLRAAGLRPGVVSRGYGGHAEYPLRLDATVTPAQAGDEPVLLFQRGGVPVVVDPRRARAVQCLQSACDVVICDDGLQHYALGRDVEIAVVDATRGLGNGWLLPAGPLREAASRLRTVDQVVVNGAGGDWPGAQRMRLVPESWRAVGEGGQPLPAPGGSVHAVAGIGNPERFFEQLRTQGFEVIAHAFPDHHAYRAQDLAFGDMLPVVMTEKDMVKCRSLPAANWWYVPVRAELPEAFYEKLFEQLHAVLKVKKNAG